MIGAALFLSFCMSTDQAPLECAQTLVRLGAIDHREFKLAQADAATRRAVAIYERLGASESAAYAYSLANLAAILADQEQYVRAETVLRRALFLLRKSLTATDPAIGRLEANLGIIYLRQGEYRKAELTLTLVLEQFHPAQATVWGALAELSIAERRWPQAEARLRQAFELGAGQSGSQMAGLLHLRAVVEAHQGDLRAAAADLQRAIELVEAATGSSTTVLANFLEEHSGLLKRMGHPRQAKAERTKARTIRRYAQNQ